jgi:hypothetical protein
MPVGPTSISRRRDRSGSSASTVKGGTRCIAKDVGVATALTGRPLRRGLLAYVGQGNRYNCSDFKSQADAQAVLRADPSDPNRLDTDRDGIACESNPDPRDLVKVPRA